VYGLVAELTGLLTERNSRLGQKRFLGHVFSEDLKQRKRGLERRYRKTCYEYLLRKKPLLVAADALAVEDNKDESNEQDAVKDRLLGEGLKYSLTGEVERCQKLVEASNTLDWNSPGVVEAVRFLLQLADSGPNDDPRGSTNEFTQIGDGIDEYGLEKLDPRNVKSYQQQFNFQKQPFGSLLVASQSIPSLGFQPIKRLEFQPKSVIGAFIEEPARTPQKDAGGKQVEDEGYHSPVQQLQDETNIWDRIWEVEVPQRQSWENFGVQSPENDKPFLSEAGPITVHHLWKLCMMDLSLVYPILNPPALKVVEEKTLCLHICYLVAGIQTKSFFIDQSTQRFEMAEGLCVPSLSPECTDALCKEYREAGNIYTRLDNLASEQCIGESSILSGFCTGLAKYLRLYSSTAIHLGTKFSILAQLHQALRPMLEALQMLGSICGAGGSEEEEGWQQLPRGVQLLSFLLKISVHVCTDRGNLVLVSLFRAAVNPYFRFLKRWLYAGECETSKSAEYGLLMDTRYVNNRTADYWYHTYSLLELEDSGPATAFLADIQEKVYSTGKSLALLRLICPDHHLTGRYRELQPPLMLAVTADDQTKLRLSVDAYGSCLTEAAAKNTVSLAQKKEREKEERIQEAILVRQRHDALEEKVRQEREETRRRKEDKQKACYDELKEQAAQSRARREAERLKRDQEEQKLQAEIGRVAEEASRREEEDRLRVTQFYARLEREAEDRERRADWRFKRNNPAFKSRRILLHRELDTSLAHRLRMAAGGGHNKAGGDVHIVDNETSNTFQFSDILIKEDEMGNFAVEFKDREGNLVTDNLDTIFMETETINLLSSRPFPQLPDYLRKQILHSLEYRANKHSAILDRNTEDGSKPSVFPSPRRQEEASIGHLLGANGAMEFPDRNGNMEVDDSGDVTDAPIAERKRSSAQPIERLLYPQRFRTPEVRRSMVSKTDIVLKTENKPIPYTKSFPELKYPSKQEEENQPALLQSKNFPPLSLILQNSVLVPLRVQKKLVDSALLSHLLVDLQLEDHFTSLRRYLLLADGEFGRQLVVSLCQLGREIQQPGQLAGQLHHHIQDGGPPPALLCPTSLNRVLETALTSSLTGSTDPLARNLTFTLRETSSIGIPGLSLGYRSIWPLNIVLSEEVLRKYSTVVEYMLNLRTSLVGLELDWANENIVLRKNRKTFSYHQHRIGLMRHEMLNFLRNLHSYVTAQVLEVSWMEFQSNLTLKVSCLDELISYHVKYINRILFRCLLNQKAAPLMNIINNIIMSINKFSSLVMMRQAVCDEGWKELADNYQTFRKNSKFLFALVTKLHSRGYQPHFQDLLVRLNFNGFYDTALNSSLQS